MRTFGDLQMCNTYRVSLVASLMALTVACEKSPTFSSETQSDPAVSTKSQVVTQNQTQDQTQVQTQVNATTSTQNTVSTGTAAQLDTKPYSADVEKGKASLLPTADKMRNPTLRAIRFPIPGGSMIGFVYRGAIFVQVLTGVANTTGGYVSYDAGVTFKKLGFDIENYAITNDTLYVVDSTMRLMTSTDGGRNFAPTSQPLPSPLIFAQGNKVFYTTASGDKEKGTVLVSKNMLSTDKGASFSEVPTAALVSANEKMFDYLVGHMTGMYTGSSLSNDFLLRFFTTSLSNPSLFVTPNFDMYAFSTADNSSPLQVSKDKGKSFASVSRPTPCLAGLIGDGADLMIAMQGCSNSGSQNLHISLDSGRSWNGVNFPVTFSSPDEAITRSSFVYDGKVYFFTHPIHGLTQDFMFVLE